MALVSAPATATEPGQIAEIFESLAPGFLERREPVVGGARLGGLASVSAPTRKPSVVELPTAVDRAVRVGSASIGLAPEPTEQLGDAVRLQENAVAFVGENLTQIAVDRGGGEYGLATLINNADAGERFTYRLQSPHRLNIAIGKSGGALFLHEGKAIGGAFAPWAVDANGVRVPTRYVASGNALIQVVHHVGRGYAYPIVADPTYYGESLVNRVVTRNATKGRELSVYASDWFRFIVQSPALVTQQVRLQVTDEFARMTPSPWDTLGARQQVSCHVWWATQKYPWNIELWRPTVGEAATTRALCNPK